jgi:predicted MFS family arabinose efflux permease
MIGLVFVASLLGAPVWPAFAAAVPNLVEEADLSWANSLLSLTSGIGRTAGPVAGGMLVAVIGGSGVFALDAATFAAIGLAVWLATGRYEDVRGKEAAARSSGFWIGFRHIATSPVLLSVVAAWTIMWLSVDIAWVADAPLARELDVGSVGFGLISSLFGIGAILGGLSGRWLTQRREPPALFLGTVGVTVGFALVGLAPLFAVVLLGQVVAAFVDNLGAVAGTNLLQRRTPDAIRGRVFGAIGAAGLIMNVPAFLLGGLLVGAVGGQGVYLIGGAVALVAAAVMVPGLRALRAENAATSPAGVSGELE